MLGEERNDPLACPKPCFWLKESLIPDYVFTICVCVYRQTIYDIWIFFSGPS